MSSQTLKQLQTIAKELKIKGYSKLKKDDLYKLIQAHNNEHKEKGIQCNALIYHKKTLCRCDEYSTEKYCSIHRYRYKIEKPEECTICFCKFDDKEIPLNCGHWFHKECLKPTNVHSCPVCRNNMDKSDIKYIFGEKHKEKNNYTNNDLIEYCEFVQSRSQHDEYVDEIGNEIIELNQIELEYLEDLLFELIEYKIQLYDTSRIINTINIEEMIFHIFQTNQNQLLLFRISKISDIKAIIRKAKTSFRPIFNFINIQYFSDLRNIFTVIDSIVNNL